MKQHKKNLPMDLDKYIKVYDNALDVNLCRNILHSTKNVEMKRWDRGGRPQFNEFNITCLLYTSPSPRDMSASRMPSSA